MKKLRINVRETRSLRDDVNAAAAAATAAATAAAANDGLDNNSDGNSDNEPVNGSNVTSIEISDSAVINRSIKGSDFAPVNDRFDDLSNDSDHASDVDSDHAQANEDDAASDGFESVDSGSEDDANDADEDASDNSDDDHIPNILQHETMAFFWRVARELAANGTSLEVYRNSRVFGPAKLLLSI
jgi:hypothetical protein